MKKNFIFRNPGQTTSRIKPSKVINNEFREIDDIFPGTVSLSVSQQIKKIIFHLKEKKQNHDHNCESIKSWIVCVPSTNVTTLGKSLKKILLSPPPKIPPSILLETPKASALSKFT